MLSVDIEKIIPVTEARDMFNKIVDEVEGSDELYVLTKNGKPAAVVVGINHLEKLTGETNNEVMAKVDKAGEGDSSDDFNKDMQFNTSNAAGTTPAATSAPAEPEPSAKPAEATPTIGVPPKPLDGAALGDLTPDDESATAAPEKEDTPVPTAPLDDPFMPSAPSDSSATSQVATSTPPSSQNPPGSTGGPGDNFPPAKEELAPDPMAQTTPPAGDNLNPPPANPGI